MDPSEFPSKRSSKKELQGPRPTPLRINQDSHKISKKPPIVPRPPLVQQSQARPPVIIYTVSPKIIHAKPCDFKKLVQRLTGLESSSSSSSSSTVGASFSGDVPMPDIHGGAISPAARYASIERATRANPDWAQNSQISNREERERGFVHEMEIGNGVGRPGNFPGILSPGPSSLSPIPASFFSPVAADPSSLNFFYDLSPSLHGNRSFIEGYPFLTSPSTFASPTQPSMDLFNNFPDL